MSRTKLLLDVVEDMRALADSLQAVATALAENELAEAPSKPAEGTTFGKAFCVPSVSQKQ